MAQKQGPLFFAPMVPGFSGKLSIPLAFLKHLVGEKCDKAILKSPLGKSWHVKVHRADEGMWFEEGWFDFVLDHDLQAGEFLVLRYDGDMVFYVTIYDTSACEKELPLVNKENQNHSKQRCTEDEEKIPFVKKENKDNGKCMEDHVDVTIHGTSSCEKKLPFFKKKSKGNGKQRGKVRMSCSAAGVERVLSCKAEHPHFTVTIAPSNLLRKKPYINIPMKFQRVNGISKMQIMALTDPKGRSWPVRVARRARGTTYFGTGWDKFFVMNGLQVGDVCIFQLANTRMDLMDVHIMKLSNIHNIPMKFQRVNGISKMQIMALTDPKGRSWPVRVARRARGTTYFGTGWDKFFVMNGLQVGDVCIFQLANTRMDLMDVHIMKLSNIHVN